jgi:CheY-like chemotaxis protein
MSMRFSSMKISNRSVFGPSGQAHPATLATARLLLVDGDVHRRFVNRQWLETAGTPEPEVADTGDEALDILGAAAQQFDAVIFWPALRDAAAVDFTGVLRRCRSPVRMMAVTRAHVDDLPMKGRLAGITAVDDTDTPRGLVLAVRRVLEDGLLVAEIVRDKRVPLILGAAWAEAIYGTRPGGQFYADLD